MQSAIVIDSSFLLTNFEVNIEKNKKNHWTDDNVDDVTTICMAVSRAKTFLGWHRKGKSKTSR